MRKFIISLLLAGAAASPALAQDHGRWHQDEAQSNNQQSHDDRSQAREQRQEMREQARSERGGNAERMQEIQQQQQVRQQQQQARQYEGRQQWQGQGGGWDRSRIEGQRAAQQQVLEQQRQQQAERSYRGYRGGFAGQVQQVDPSQRSGTWARDRRNWSQDRDGDFRQRQVEQQHARQGSRWAGGGWNRDWRNDRRYDWRSYRDRHRSVFRLGVYFDPFGYGYRPFDIGYNLSPLYFGQRYWIDPALYELPYPPPGTVWVRYWNDAVLVDTYTGEVVDVIHNFFW